MDTLPRVGSEAASDLVVETDDEDGEAVGLAAWKQPSATALPYAPPGDPIEGRTFAARQWMPRGDGEDRELRRGRGRT